MASTFGIGILGRFDVPMTFETWFGLWLNLDRLWLKNAVQVNRGIWTAFSKQTLPHAWYEAGSLMLEQAGLSKWEVQKKESVERTKKQAGW